MLCFPPATTDFSLATVSLTNVVGVRQIRDKNIQIAVINSKGTFSSPSPKAQSTTDFGQLGYCCKIVQLLANNYEAAVAVALSKQSNHKCGSGLAISTVGLATIL